MTISWLPPLALLNDYDGDWDKYLEAVYLIFETDFKSSVTCSFHGLPVRLKKNPITYDKEATFWHFISTGANEAEREVDLRRCERIAWPKAIIMNCDDPSLKIWEERKKGETRIHIWCEDQEYLFVIAKRSNFVLPWTAYPVTQNHQKRKLKKRWEENK